MDDREELVDRLIEVLKQTYFRNDSLRLESFLQGETKVLSYILNMNREMLPGEIAASLEMTPARIAGVLRSLEKKGYVVRRINENDRRKVIVSITDSGSEFVRNCTARLRGCLSELIEIMGKSASEQLISSLNDFSDASDILALRISHNDCKG